MTCGCGNDLLLDEVIYIICLLGVTWGRCGVVGAR